MVMRVPVVNGPSVQQQGIGTPYASARAPAGAFGEGLARGLGDVAQVLAQQQEQEEVRWISQVTADARAYWTKNLLERQNSAAPGANGFTHSVSADYGTYARAALENAPSARARDILGVKLKEIGTGVQTDAFQFELKERNSHLAHTARGNIDLGAGVVAADPRQYDAVQQDGWRTLAAMDLPAEMKRELVTYQRKALSSAAIMGEIQRDPAAAARALAGGFGEIAGDAERWRPQVAAASKEFGVPEGLAMAVLSAESAGRPDAVSPAGARGLMQLMPGTAADLGVDPNDPEQNVRGGIQYLGQQLKAFDGNVTHALVAYNWGPGNARKWLDAGGDQASLPAETRAYVEKVLGGQQGAGSIPGMESLTVQERVQLHGLAEREATRRGAEAARAEAESRARYVSDFEIGLSRGEKTYADVERAYTAGRITPGERARYTLALDKVTAERAAMLEAFRRVEAAGQGGVPPLDPKNGDDRKVLDEHYRLTAQSWQGLQPTEVMGRAAAYAAQKGMVPADVQGMIRAGLVSTDWRMQVAAAGALAAIKAANPALLNDFSEASISRGNLIAEWSAAGVPADEAARRLQELDRVPEATRKARAVDFNAALSASVAGGKADQAAVTEGVKALIAEAFDDRSWWNFTGATPAVEAAAAADFTRVALSDYQMNGNIEAAKRSGLDAVRRVWGLSRLTGAPVVMRYAPEKVYGIPGFSAGENAAWMQEQLAADIAAAEAGPGLRETEDGDISDALSSGRISLTPMEEGAQPSYAVQRLGSDGVYYAVFDQRGRPLAWRPDYASSPAAKRLAGAREKSVDEARQERARLKGEVE